MGGCGGVACLASCQRMIPTSPSRRGRTRPRVGLTRSGLAPRIRSALRSEERSQDRATFLGAALLVSSRSAQSRAPERTGPAPSHPPIPSFLDVSRSFAGRIRGERDYERRDAQATTKSTRKPTVQRSVHLRSPLGRPPAARAALTSSTISPPTPKAARAVAIARMMVSITAELETAGPRTRRVPLGRARSTRRRLRHVGGARELDPSQQVEAPRPAPRRCAHNAKRRPDRVLDRVG
jgi:hypothetical protein